SVQFNCSHHKKVVSHTAGLSLDGYPGWTPNDTLPTIEESLNGKTNGSGHVEIILKPGTTFQYSGGGYTILQLIIEEVTGQKFEDYMQEQILAPLGMNNSSFKIDDNILAASASPYDNFGEPTHFELFTAQAAAGLHSTIEDFTRFAIANLYQNESQERGNPVLSAEIIQQMMEPAQATEGGYGLGYKIRTGGLLKSLRGHTGGNTGWQSMYMVDPASNDGFIVFTNGGAGYNLINVVLCEWIAWNKGEEIWEGCDIQLSIANKLKQTIDKNGIEGIAVKYATLKEEHPEAFNYSENQLNNLGYFYLGRNELEKAIAIFKTNVSAFPNAYNVYDSYGEALLAHGDREGAIENYLRSVELNPGNGNGVEILKGLGISTEDLIQHFSIDVDPKILEEYAGHYQTSTGETVTIGNNKGHLTAELNQQELNLIAQSAARFIALGDGAIFSLFTAATGQKGLWAKERIWRKLPNAPDMESTPLSTSSFLVFRNKSSWNRLTDFENVLAELGCTFLQGESTAMANLDLSTYDVIIIPGQQNGDYYKDYINNVERFDEYVAKGGTLVLELNGATKSSITLPRGVTVVPHPALENAILEPDHPIFLPLEGKQLIWARHASSGYLQDVPGDALVLAAETNGVDALPDRPTFIEYPYGQGRVIAALQCFHDQDSSGRGPLMESVLSYALSKSWALED
ncbi:MAG: serine hydrolase, partial [Saprospiraceae bacterium]|nr:serine hydrolase [Saprospiraceae bacterium]